MREYAFYFVIHSVQFRIGSKWKRYVIIFALLMTTEVAAVMSVFMT